MGGPKKHMKRLTAPKSWMLDKLTGRFCPRPSAGPHKLRECLPLIVLLRDRLKYALTGKEVQQILKQRKVLVDGKSRTDVTYPAGFMDVVSIPDTEENFRLMYDQKGRYTCVKVSDEDAKWKLGKVVSSRLGPKGVPFICLHDGKTVRYPDPDTKVGDTVKIDLASMRPTGLLKFEVGATVMVSGGRNRGRIGTLTARDRHPGMFDIVHIKDAKDAEFATRLGNIMVISAANSKPEIALPRAKGVKLTISEERDRRFAQRAKESSA